VRWSAWSIGEREPGRVVMEQFLHPQPGYPFSLAVSIEYALSDQGLTIATTATNAGPGRARTRAAPIRTSPLGRRTSTPSS
jgi:aldose 1-epimerase